MPLTLAQFMLEIGKLPNSLPLEGAVNIELQEGVLVLRALKATQEQVEKLLQKQKIAGLSSTEKTELDGYEKIDNHLSLINRLSRNLTQIQN